jgi:hypothetical protein
MRCLIARLTSWLHRKPKTVASVDPVLADLNRREQAARRIHGPVRSIQQAKTDRMHELLKRGA